MTLYAETHRARELLYTTTLADPVNSGQTSPGIVVDLNPQEVSGKILVLTVDKGDGGDGNLIECDETDNTLEGPEPTCG